MFSFGPEDRRYGLGCHRSVTVSGPGAGYRMAGLDIQRARPRVLIARHGQTTWNREGRIQGQADPPLDATGLRQAWALALDLTRSGRPSLVVASDLRRARQTAVPIARAARCPLRFHPGLREVDVGHWEGRLRAEIQAEEPTRYADWVRGRRSAPGSPETIKAAGARVLATLTTVACHGDGSGCVVVVGHGLGLQAAFTLLAGGTAPHLANGEWIELVDTALADRALAPS